MTSETETRTPTYAALRLMERTTPPLRYGRPPYWRAPEPFLDADPFVPSWNWVAIRDFAPGAELLTLDANAAFLGAIGSVTIAHSHLDHTGAFTSHPAPRDLPPGYYKITIPHWAFSGTIVSPLGDSSRLETESAVWVMSPTLQLLLELEYEGHIGGFDILDSHTASVQTTFRSWAQKLGAERTQRLDHIDMAHPEAVVPKDCGCPACRRYVAFKEGYSIALSMMLTGERCATHRPDWSRTVYAAHSANQWRKAWRFTYTGGHLVSMGHIDEIQILRDDLPEAMSRPKPPFRLDSTGRAVGALKIKREGVIAEEIQNDVLPENGWEDIV